MFSFVTRLIVIRHSSDSNCIFDIELYCRMSLEEVVKESRKKASVYDRKYNNTDVDDILTHGL